MEVNDEHLRQLEREWQEEEGNELYYKMHRDVQRELSTANFTDEQIIQIANAIVVGSYGVKNLVARATSYAMKKYN